MQLTVLSREDGERYCLRLCSDKGAAGGTLLEPRLRQSWRDWQKGLLAGSGSCGCCWEAAVAAAAGRAMRGHSLTCLSVRFVVVLPPSLPACLSLAVGSGLAVHRVRRRGQ